MKHEKISAVLFFALAFGLDLIGLWLLQLRNLGLREMAGVVSMLLAGGFLVAARDLGGTK